MDLEQLKDRVESVAYTRWFRLLALLTVSIVVLWLLMWFVVRPTMLGSARDALNRKLVEVTGELGGTLTVGGIEATMDNEVVLADVDLGDAEGRIVSIPRLRLGFSIVEVLSGSRMPKYVILEDMTVHLDTDPETFRRLAAIKDRLKEFGRRAAGRWKDRESSEDGSRPARRSGDLPDIGIENALVSLVDSDTREPILSLTDINFHADGSHMIWDRDDHEGSWWDIDGSLSLVGLKNVEGDTETELEVEGDIEPGQGFRLKVASDKPFEAPKNSKIPAVVALGSFDVEMDRTRGRINASLGNLRLTELGQLAEKITHGKFGIDGELSMESASLELNIGDRPDLSDLSIERLVNLSVSGARFSAGFPDGRSISMKDVAVKMSPLPEDTEKTKEIKPASSRRGSAREHREIVPVWGVELTGVAGTGNLDYSPFSLSGRFTREMEFVDGHLRTEGALPVGVLSMLHKRVLAWGRPSLLLDVDLNHDGEFWKVAGHASGRDLTYFWTKICLVPLTGLSFDTDFELLVSRAEKVMNARLSSFRIGDFELTASLEYEHSRAQPVVKAQVNIPKQPCQNVYDAIPKVMMPRLVGTRVSGDMSFEVKLDLDPARASTFTINPDLESCMVQTFGDQVDLDLLLSDGFIHRVVETDKEPWEEILTGPGSDSFTTIDQIPVWVQQAALATEDMNFFVHKGFAPGLIKRAIVLNLDKGWYVYGGSTISQQLVKNLFLSREKTIGRKLEEAIIVWEMERRIPKEKTLELYLNCIEFGYHLYGITAAAKEYFNKKPSELTPLESAFIMATKPSPKSAWNVYRKKVLGKWWVERLEGILKRLWAEMDVISEEDYMNAAPWIPTFWYQDEGVYVKPEIVGVPDVPAGFPAALPNQDGAVPDGQQGVVQQAGPGAGQVGGNNDAAPEAANEQGRVRPEGQNQGGNQEQIQPPVRQEALPAEAQ